MNFLDKNSELNKLKEDSLKEVKSIIQQFKGIDAIFSEENKLLSRVSDTLTDMILNDTSVFGESVEGRIANKILDKIPVVGTATKVGVSVAKFGYKEYSLSKERNEIMLIIPTAIDNLHSILERLKVDSEYFKVEVKDIQDFIDVLLNYQRQNQESPTPSIGSEKIISGLKSFISKDTSEQQSSEGGSEQKSLISKISAKSFGLK